MDTDLLWFYVRVWQLRVTDLMQGPVYGIFTDETGSREALLPFFNYDELFGTVLNRFVVQAVDRSVVGGVEAHQQVGEILFLEGFPQGAQHLRQRLSA